MFSGSEASQHQLTPHQSLYLVLNCSEHQYKVSCRPLHITYSLFLSVMWNRYPEVTIVDYKYLYVYVTFMLHTIDVK